MESSTPASAAALTRPATPGARALDALRNPLWPALAIALLAAALRLDELGLTRTAPYYDAAVRSMGESWHNFFFAAYEPGASVAIDKPPLDLWLQVASTKLFGLGAAGLLLPQALAGSATAGLLYDLVRRPFGQIAGIVAALAAVVLPISVVTARSDTMDTLLAALTVAAAWLIVRALETRHARWLYAAAAVAGLAFEVKLFEALIGVPALVALYAIGSDERVLRRLRQLAIAALIYAFAALWWPLAVTFAPGPKPYALGSSNGHVLNAIVKFNGIDRLSGSRAPTAHSKTHRHGRATSAAASRRRARASSHGSPPGPLRLLHRGGSRYGQYIGGGLAAAAVLALLAVALSIGRTAALSRARLRRALGWWVALWLVPGVVAFSTIHALHLRYLEAIGPAVAAAIGIAIGALVSAARVRRVAVVGLALGAVVAAGYFAWATGRSLDLVRRHGTDSGHVGQMPPAETARLAGYLAAHSPHTRYEVVSATYQTVAALIVHDGRPVLIGTGTARRPLVRPARLHAEVAAGRLRYALVGDKCGTAKLRHTRRCPAATRWIRTHGTDVSRAAGLHQRGVLFLLRA